MQRVAKGAQTGFVKGLAPGGMGVNCTGHIFKARPHFQAKPPKMT